MEYQFEHDPLTGRAIARFNLEHEAFGPFFSDELRDDEVQIVHLQRSLRQSGRNVVQFHGREWTLLIDGDEVQLSAHETGIETEAGALQLMEDDAIHRIDGVETIQCGREDFGRVLDAWHLFVRGG